jgi:hypothetical protein
MLKSSTTGTGKVLGALVAMVAVIVPAVSAPASVRHAGAARAAATSAALRALCHSAGPVPVTAIPANVDLATCPLQGRKLFLPLRNGKPVVGLYVPGPGDTETATMLTTKGSYMLSVTNSHGRLVIKTSRPGAPAPAIKAAARRTDAACGESNYKFLGAKWTKTLVWYYNASTASRAGLTASLTTNDIRAGNYNMTMGINNCGFSQKGFRAYGQYAGTTSKYANIDSNGDCIPGHFPDGQNTVSWGDLNNNGIAFDCSIASNGSMTESDIYLGSNQKIVDDLPPDCLTYSNRDLQTVATHEWGHAFGLADLGDSNSKDLVMYNMQKPCSLRRHLGKGDYDGMGGLYGWR